MVFDPLAAFPQFYGNPHVQRLSAYPRWTVSADIGVRPASSGDAADENLVLKQRKAPIDIQHFFAGCGGSCRHESPLRGAYRVDETCLVDLPTLTARLPEAANCAFHLRSEHDGLMVVDIEKTCPPEIAAQLLSVPGAVYSELSMSGKGYHLLVPLPANLESFPLAAAKTVLKEEHGWYEILFEHWITFTRRPIPAWRADELRFQGSQAPTVDEEELAKHAAGTFEQLYANLAQHATESISRSGLADLSGLSAGNGNDDEITASIPMAEHVIGQTLARGRDRLKTLEDFGHDHSRWEFSVLGSLCLTMTKVITDLVVREGQTYTDDQVAWMLHCAAKKVIPPREKHFTTRYGQPFLLHQAAVQISQLAARR